jgi:hypothetical protein
MSVFSYGNIEFDHVLTTSYNQEPVMSEDGTDKTLTKYTLGVRGTYNPTAMSYVAGDGQPNFEPGQDPAQTDNAIRAYLLTPRRKLHYEDDHGNVIFDSPADGADYDPGGGPFPKSCSIAIIGGSQTWLVTFSVEIYINECDDAPVPYLSNRWSQTQLTDKQHMTTVTTAGVTKFDLAKLLALGFEQSADFWRRDLVPAVQLGFKRESIRVVVSPRGDTVNWETVDKQMMYHLGDNDNPARLGVIEFNAVYSQQTVSANHGHFAIPTGMVIESIDVHVVGAIESKRSELLQFASKLAVERTGITAGNANPGQNPIFRAATVRQTLSDRIVDMHIEAMFGPPANAQAGVSGLRFDYLMNDGIASIANDGRNPQMPADNNTRGLDTAIAFSQALKLACTVPSLPTAVLQGTPDAESTYLATGSLADISIGELLPGAPTPYSEDHLLNGPYTDYAVDMQFKRKQHVLQSPVAAPIDSNNPTPAEVMTLAAPTSNLRVSFTGERAGMLPPIPLPVLSDSNYTLVDSEVITRAPIPMPDGTRIGRVTGYYDYVTALPIGAGDPLPSGALPWGNFSYGDNVYTNYRSDIIDSGNSLGHGPVGGNL